MTQACVFSILILMLDLKPSPVKDVFIFTSATFCLIPGTLRSNCGAAVHVIAGWFLFVCLFVCWPLFHLKVQHL